ncbi:MAG TPA: replication-relaxation family protein [Ktedonobacteraceae bacterium]
MAMPQVHESAARQHRPARRLTIEALAEREASLTALDWRLLYWLLRYPLQRVDDLVVGVARWASRATVYRRIQGLETSGLVESVMPKTPGTGRQLYYLSNLGLHLVAKHLGTPARELARSWQADEAGLLHLLPRLPTLLVLQEVVNGLVTHAADAMTTHGRRPQLVRWNWQRDVTHRFHYREQAMRCFADGAVALCIRTQQSDGSTLHEWYGLFILFTELDDERLMRHRVERLLCWRESAERWSYYQHMLPVLILASSLRQCDHWQCAVEVTALKLRLAPLAGALTTLLQPERAHGNPWLLNWHTLSTAVSCHLQDLLQPLPVAAFPSVLRLEEGQEEVSATRAHANASEACGASGSSARLTRLLLGGLATRAAHIQDGLEEQEVTALLGLLLTACQWSILRLMLAHPLLLDEELAAFLHLQRRSVRCTLYELHRLGCLEPILTEAGKRWHLCRRGLRLIAETNQMPIRNLTVTSDDEADNDTSTMVLRGEAWLVQHIRHTAGIYGFFARLAQASRQEPDQELCWWETGAACERRYRVGEQWYNLRPDALAEYMSGPGQIRFWLEWDRGTMNGRDLAIKFTSYAHYVASREWAREDSMLPFLFCVAPDIAQERRMQRVAQARLIHTHGLMVWTTTEVLLNQQGPLSSIWLQGMSRSNQSVQTGKPLRRRLSDMIPGKKSM